MVHFQISYCSLVPVILLVHTTNEDGTECFETSAQKIQSPGNHSKKEYNKVLQFCEGVQECMWRFASHDTLSLTSFTRSQSQKYKTCKRRRADWSLWLVFLSCNRNFILGRLVATLTRIFYLLAGHTDLNNLAVQMGGCACIWEAIQAVLIELPRTTFHFDAHKFNVQSFYGHCSDSD
jgi:hypothetical protein